MYLRPKEAMEFLQITTRQGLHKIVKNHNITVKSQGVGKPNLYLKADLERYKKDNAKNIKAKKNPQVIEKAKENKKKKENRLKEIKKTSIIVKKELDKIDKEDETNIYKEDFDNIHSDLDISYEEMTKPFNRLGKEKFEETIGLLKEMGLYKDVDLTLVEVYSICFQEVKALEVAYRKSGMLIYDSFGNPRINPIKEDLRKTRKELNDFAKQLGIGAKSRQGLEIKQEKKESMIDILNSKEEFD